MGHLEGNFTPVLYIGRTVPKGYYSNDCVSHLESYLDVFHCRVFKITNTTGDLWDGIGPGFGVSFKRHS